MANVLAQLDTADRESAAIGPSKGEELAWLDDVCDDKRQIATGAWGVNLSELVGNDETEGPKQVEEGYLPGRKVDGVVYDQYYLEPSEQNLRLLLVAVNYYQLQLPTVLEEQFSEIKEIMNSGARARIDELIASIQQLRLFDARDKDISNEEQDFHPITIDIKFKAAEGDALNRRALKWRANENGDEKMMQAIDVLKSLAGGEGRLGHVRRYIIAYEWLPPSIVEAVKTELGIREVEADVLEQIINAIAAEFAVKLDVRYDVVTNPDGVEVKIVTREAEVNGRDDDAVNWQLDMLCEALDESGYVTFVPDQLNYGELALSAQPGEHVDAVLEGKGVDVKTIRAEMEAQVDRVMEAYPEGNQIVVDLVDKAGVIARLTSAGDSDKAFREVITVVEEARSKIGRP